MCGIIGHVAMAGQIADWEAVKHGSQMINHRGPDGDGLIVLPQVCLAHRRLSIIDLEGSPQPWLSACGRYHMVFNGEIYNYIELRKELEREGFNFQSQGDTEVLMNLYISKGEQCLEKLNGMFAFAVWDEKERSLFMARDRLGKKPLFYANSNKGLVFASELSAFSGFSFLDSEIDPNAVNDFFAHQFIGEERTIYSNIRKLLPAHTFRFQHGQINLKRYWEPPFPCITTSHENELCEELEELLFDAVRLRLRSDVPLGAFLSGGLDSSLIAAIIKEQNVSVNTYTIGFEQATYDESKLAKQVSQAIGTNHNMMRADISDLEVLRNCLNSFGEPFADPSAIPTWHLCQYARKGVTVAMSGDGVDEIFGGYRRYQARQWAQAFSKLPGWLKNKVMGGIIAHLPESTRYYANSPTKKLKLFYSLLKRMAESPNDLLAQTFTHHERQRLFKNGQINAKEFDYIKKFNLDNLDPVSMMMAADQRTYLTENILTKVDRMSMQHGLEVRSPFLDYRIVEFACRLPLKFKLQRGVQKYLLRKCYAGKIPDFVMKRKKHGFAVPLGNWFKGALRDPFEQLVLDRGIDSLLNRDEVLLLWNQHQTGRIDHGFKLWSIFSFYHWSNNQKMSL